MILYFCNCFQNILGITNKVVLPVADDVYKSIVTLPIFPTMNNDDIIDVINALNKIIIYFKKEKSAFKLLFVSSKTETYP